MILIDIYNEIIEHEIIPESMQNAVSVLIPKGGDKLSAANYRPITLLNTDYKILTKYLNRF